MIEYGNLWIIPDERKTISTVFSRQVENGVSHTSKMMEFVKEYGLDINFSEEDYHEAPCMIAIDGHIVIKSIGSDKQLVFYLPKTVTNYQLTYLTNNYELFSKYYKIGCYSLKILEEDGIVWKTLHGMDEIIRELNKKNLSYINEENIIKGGK